MTPSKAAQEQALSRLLTPQKESQGLPTSNLIQAMKEISQEQVKAVRKYPIPKATDFTRP
jgi:hypothetical protein